VDYVSNGFLFALCETGWGNYGKVENIRWEGVRVVYFHIRSSEGGSLQLCRLRTASVGTPATSIDYVLTHTGYMSPRKLNSFDSHRVGRYLTLLHG
jgi:hypothetical protein